jgi:hypothetical protein
MTAAILAEKITIVKFEIETVNSHTIAFFYTFMSDFHFVLSQNIFFPRKIVTPTRF